MSNPLDLKKLIQLINDQKDIKAELILDEGCIINVDDQGSLVKVINYFLNYLHAITKGQLNIGLDLMGDKVLLSFIAYTSEASVPEVSTNVADALKQYNAKFEFEHKAGSYVQIKVHFSK